MHEGKHCEIERKYLIAPPDPAFLKKQSGCVEWRIEQIYLTAEPGTTRRVRRVTEEGQDRFYKTFKRRLSDLSAEEDEGLISRSEYEAYLRQADPRLKPILKTRYRVPFVGQTLEFDVYPFWDDRAILEIELESESQTPVIPDWTLVYRDVTADSRYKNVRLAAQVPMDALPPQA